MRDSKGRFVLLMVYKELSCAATHAPLLVFPEIRDEDGKILCYSRNDEHENISMSTLMVLARLPGTVEEMHDAEALVRDYEEAEREWDKAVKGEEI